MDHATVSLTPDHRTDAEHFIGHIGLADRRAAERDTKTRSNILRHPACGTICHDWPLTLAQEMIRTKRERIFLSDIMSPLIDYRQSVGVRILAETDRRLTADQGIQNLGEIFCGRLRLMIKLAIGHTSEQSDIAMELLEKTYAEQSTRSMIGIQKH